MTAAKTRCGKLLSRIASGLIVLVLGAGSCALAQAGNAGPQRRWQPPPPPKTWNAQEHHGYMDGIDGAWLDLGDHLSPKPSRHLNWQHPPNVPVSKQYWYRQGYDKGYQAVYRHEHGSQDRASTSGKPR